MAHFQPYPKFPKHNTNRAQRRIQGEDVFGNKIKVFPSNVKNYTGRKVKNDLFQDEAAGPANYHSEIKQDDCMFKPINDHPETSTWGSTQLNRRSATPQDSSSNSDFFKNNGFNYTDDRKVNHKSDDESKSQPIKVIIANLDPSLGLNEIRRTLTAMIEKYTSVISLNVIVPPDGSVQAHAIVGNQQEAQYMISQLQRQKLGHRRITISYWQNSSIDLKQLRAIVVDILQDAPGRAMPLFKFISVLNTRYHCTVSVSEISKLKDVCKISNDSGSRVISLAQELSNFPSDRYKAISPYCTIHSLEDILTSGWGVYNTFELPNVMVSLRFFSEKLNALLESHGGSMPLLSFQSCYKQEFQTSLQEDEGGVPLEHLITCVPNVEIKHVLCMKDVKIIKFSQRKVDGAENSEETVMKSFAPSLAPNIALFCRELVELLKNVDKCRLPVYKFSPTYHHHFSRQCRVADYGFTKILDLFESIPHVIQVMGDNTRKVITLSHSAQMRRFTGDLLKVLKAQPFKQINFDHFPAAYEKILKRPFDPVQYGLCTFEDLLQEVPKNVIVMGRKEDETVMISIPKRQQTQMEIMRTEQFALEVVDLLRHSPYYSLPFNYFIPAYHHHFGHQCRVSDYGFTKLNELFEAIPEYARIEESRDGQKMIHLSLQQSVNILCSQMIDILKDTPTCSLPLMDLPDIYLKKFGYPLKPHVYECSSMFDLVAKLSDYIRVVESDAGPSLVAIDVDTNPETLSVRFWALLLDEPHCKDLGTLRYQYQMKFKKNFSMEGLHQIKNAISISSVNDINFISLTALYILAAQLYQILYKQGGAILFSKLEQLYQETYNEPLNLPENFLKYFDWAFYVSKRKNTITLNRNLAVALSGHFVQSQPKEKKAVPFDWPPPPFLNPLEALGAVRKISPPKPDSPPSPASVMWMNWNATPAYDNLVDNASQTLPHSAGEALLKGLGNSSTPVSEKPLMGKTVKKPSRISNLWCPDPTELPMPNQLIPKNRNDSLDLGDSGLGGVTGKNEDSPFSTARQLFAPDQKQLFPSLSNFDFW